MEIIKAKKKLGQNFLVDTNISQKIVNSLNIEDNEIILEVGPGTGSLTKYLLNNNCQLTALEIDDAAIKVLERTFPKTQFPNFSLIKQDILKFNFNEFFTNNDNKKFKLIGNIPYYLTTELFFDIFENSEYINRVIMMVQKEIALRLTASKSTKDYGILTLAMELSGKCKRLFDVPPNCFVPQPNVMSSVISFDFSTQLVSNSDFKSIMPLIRAGFNQRRKTLRNSLSSYINSKTGLSVDEFISDKDDRIKHFITRRAEELNANDYIYFHKIIMEHRIEGKF
jgi:16S rRNA (adenine1518-N6/adenine1519-N6)-dimethyltransferase